MKKTIVTSLIIFLTFFCFENCKKKDDLKDVDCSKVAATYSGSVKPLVISQCATSGGCHGTGSSHGDYTAYSGLKAAADNGSLENKTLTDKSMPPSGALSLDDRKKIKCWLNSGSPNN
jgi:hypothetical protein